jgi:hypothetical protein
LQVSESLPIVTDAALPALFRSSNDLSAVGQRGTLAAHGYLLLLFCTGAVVAALGLVVARTQGHFEVEVAVAAKTQQVLAAIAAVLIAAGLWLTAALRHPRKAEAWYNGRALAESTKSMAWKYMMKAEPYGPTLSRPEADELFCEDLRKLLLDAGARVFPGSSADGAQISETMVAIRELDLAERLAVYLRSRIEDQRDWYTRRSAEHDASASRWFTVVLGVNSAALVLGVSAVFWLPASDLIGVATTMASCCVAWMQLRRYSDLAHSYSFTSHEIGLLAPRANGVQTDEDLARFVADCEVAFSREHTMWRARREVAEG